LLQDDGQIEQSLSTRLVVERSESRRNQAELVAATLFLGCVSRLIQALKTHGIFRNAARN